MSIDLMKDYPEILEATVDQARKLMIPADRLAAKVLEGEGPPHLLDMWKNRNVMGTTSNETALGDGNETQGLDTSNTAGRTSDPED